MQKSSTSEQKPTGKIYEFDPAIPAHDGYTKAWRNIPTISPSGAWFNPIFVLAYKAPNGKLVLAHDPTSCKGYVEELVSSFDITKGEPTYSLRNVEKVYPEEKGYKTWRNVWKGIERPLFIGYYGSFPIPEEQIAFTRGIITTMEIRLGIKVHPAQIQHSHGPKLVLWRVSKKWISSAYLFSGLLWLMRLSSDTYYGQKREKTVEEFYKWFNGGMGPYDSGFSIHQGFNFIVENGFPKQLSFGHGASGMQHFATAIIPAIKNGTYKDWKLPS